MSTVASGAPVGWRSEARPWGEVLTAPEGDARVAIVHVPGGGAVDRAVAAAWALFAQGFRRAADTASPLSSHGGWDERWDYEYRTTPVERAATEAVAARAGSDWTVLLIDGAQATFEKRRAALSMIIQSLHPRGYQPESFAGREAHTLDAPRIAAMIGFVQAGMRQLGIPGAGLALIDHGQVVYEGGLGVRELGGKAPVDAHTRFMIASNTKGMTTLLLAKLVDQKKLRWNEKVVAAYPPFRLGDAATTRAMEIRHLVCACTGLPRQDLEWVLNTGATTPAAHTFTLLAGMQPTSVFGAVYQYSNLLAAAAGYVGAGVAKPREEPGAAYDAAMRDLIFTPLGMHDTTLDFAAAQRGDFASPHGETIDGHTEIAGPALNAPIISIRPAGGAWSSAHDMALYAQDELSQGRLPDGRQLVSAVNLLARRAPGVSMGQDQSYGMGLRNDSSSGVNVVHHGGSLAGYNSDFLVIPSSGSGAVLLTNADSGGLLLGPFRRRLLEILYDGKPEAQGDLDMAASAAEQRRKALRANLTSPADARFSASLAAHYTNPALGHIDVRRDGGGVVFDFGAWHSHVASRVNADGTVSFVTIDPAAIGKEFVVTRVAGRRGLIIRDGQHEYVYVER